MNLDTDEVFCNRCSEAACRALHDEIVQCSQPFSSYWCLIEHVKAAANVAVSAGRQPFRSMRVFELPTYRGTTLIRNNPPEDPTEALCLGTYGDPMEVGVSYERGNPVGADWNSS